MKRSYVCLDGFLTLMALFFFVVELFAVKQVVIGFLRCRCFAKVPMAYSIMFVRCAKSVRLIRA